MNISDKLKFLYIKIPKTGGETIFMQLEEHLVTDYINRDRGNHEKISEVFEKHPHTENYFKFCFVRNPFDLAVSRYFYLTQTEKDTQFKSFKEWCEKKQFFPKLQLDFISVNDEIKTNFIGRFENIQQDFNTICDKVGIPHQELPHKNKSKHKHYTEYYDEETKQIVAENYAKDIEYFGYEFGK